MAKCVKNTSKNIVRVLIPSLKFDKLLNMHFRENDELMVRDSTGKCEMGDWVLIKKMEVKKNINVDHEVVKLVYKHGHYVCPLTNKQSYGYMFKEDFDKYKYKDTDELDAEQNKEVKADASKKKKRSQ